MRPIVSNQGKVRLWAADCRDVLKTLPDCTLDSIVTDPPYALVATMKRFGKEGSAPAQFGKDGLYARASAGFMGEDWDTGETVFAVEFWAECLRVLKPGGHVVALSSTRTYHRLAVAVEDAGFEIRDQLAWVYGTGFPKSHDVAKGIQGRRVEDVPEVRKVCREIRARMDELGLKSKDLTHHFGDCNPRLIDHWAARDTDSQPTLPTVEQYYTLCRVLTIYDPDLDEAVTALNARKGERSDAWNDAEVVGEREGSTPGLVGKRFADVDKTIRELTPEAAEWEGWGTALKPAWEPIVLARKPLSEGSVAANVLAWGVGAININATRIATTDVITATRNIALGSSGAGVFAAATKPGVYEQKGEGRWPANILHDGSPEVVEHFPRTPGAKAPVTGEEPSSATSLVYGERARVAGPTPRGDDGSAARFFYCAKASKSDREEGLEAFAVERTGAMNATRDGTMLTGSGNERTTERANIHPTVKPTDLMRWLIRLVTPRGGVTLDPFMGSGSTGKAAALEGVRFVGVERSAKYLPIAQARIAFAHEKADSEFLK